MGFHAIDRTRAGGCDRIRSLQWTAGAQPGRIGVVIAGLLPGLRELRAPIAAGYVTLFSVFLLWDGRIPAEDEATGIAASLYEVAALVGTAGMVAALTFVAYITGSVVADAARFAHDRVAALQLRLDYMGVRDSALRRSRRRPSEILVRSEHSTVTNASSIGSRGTRSLGDVADRAWLEALENLQGDASAAARLAIDALGGETLDGRWLAARAAGPPPQDAAETKQAVSLGLARRTVEELDLVHTRLLGTEPELHGAVDRLRSEAELRLALVGPLVLLAVAAAARDVGGEDAFPWLTVLVMAAVPILLLQAARRRQGSGDLLSDALAIQRVQGPTLERFARLAKDPPRRT